MTTRRGTVVMIVVGVVLCVGIVFAGAAAWFFLSAFDSTVSDDATARRGFEDVRRRFEGQAPLIEIQEKTAVRTRTPPPAPSRDLQRVQILVWNPGDGRLTQITLPWWLLRLKEGPIDITGDIGDGISRTPLTVTVGELERYGPALLLDHSEPGGTRVVVWTE